MKYKIVADSTSNMFSLKDVSFDYVPMKIITSEKEYEDTPALNVPGMVEDLKKIKGTSGTSCPNVHDWIQAFGDADCVFAVTITGTLSGSYAAANQAKNDYEESHPGAQVYIVDSLSAGPEMRLIVEELRACILKGMHFSDIVKHIQNYQQHTHLMFSLQSLTNLANNGRVSPAVAKIAGIIGIRVVGRASDEGTLQPMHKCRGEKKALDTILSEMKAMGLGSKKTRIAHCFNPESAQTLKDMILKEFPGSDIEIEPTTALCSYYAEAGGLMIGFEDADAVNV